VSKSRRFLWTGYVAHRGREVLTGDWWGSLMKRTTGMTWA